MRALRISLVLFALLMALMIVGMVVIQRICNRMERLLQTLPDLPTQEGWEQAATLRDYWNKRRGVVHPAVNHTELNAVTDLMDSLLIYANPTSDEAVEYSRTRLLLCNAIDELRRLERISFSNVV